MFNLPGVVLTYKVSPRLTTDAGGGEHQGGEGYRERLRDAKPLKMLEKVASAE